MAAVPWQTEGSGARAGLGISEHMSLEIAYQFEAEHDPELPPLGLGDPVPGCSCEDCLEVATRPGEPAR